LSPDHVAVSSLKDADAVLAAIEDSGLLLLSDPKRPNAVQILTGEFPRGSWWTHPQANAIYDELQAVEDHADVALIKLIAGKVTMVHRRLWPALLGVGQARETWQLEGLLPLAAQWLAAVDQRAPGSHDVIPASRTVAKDIEARLLAYARSVHGSAGKHETTLEPWPDWSERVGAADALPVAEAKRALEEAAARAGATTDDLRWAARAR
jgi:hypothetical protein